MSYIEKDRPGEFFNPTSDTTIINPSSSSSTYTNSDENRDRWDWLISGWDRMTFKERMELYFPYLHYVNLRNSYKVDFDDSLTKEIIETAYKKCRTLDEVKFDPDGQGIPNLILIYYPIDPNRIPDENIKSKVIGWGQRYGFYKIHCRCNHNND